jgi:hypothetical protein
MRSTHPMFVANGSVCRLLIEERRHLDSRNADFDLMILDYRMLSRQIVVTCGRRSSKRCLWYA